MRERLRTRTLLAVALVIGLMLPTATPAGAIPAPAPASAPAIADLEDLLPPGARQVLAAFRIFKGLSARNRVYREADAVQRDLRAYYDARIAKAQEQLVNREQLGLEPSQVRAYWRVKAQLEAERDASLAVTEFEKRVAKYGFESAFKRELVGALLRVPKVQQGLSRMRATVEELQSTVEAARTAIATGNPVAAVVDEIDSKLADVEKYGALATLISGPAGESILSVTQRVRETIAPVSGALDDASGAADEALAQLDELSSALGAQLDEERRPRGGLDVALEEGSLVEKIAAVSGAAPAVDVISDVIARQAERRSETQRGRAKVEFARMRDRVQAAVLGQSLERIGDICNRLVGAARRVQLDAAATGSPVPDTSTPCTIYSNPEELQALIDAERAAQEAEENSTTTVESAEEVAEQPDDGETDGGIEPGAYTILDSGALAEFDLTVIGDELVISVTGDGLTAEGTFVWQYGISYVNEDLVCTSTEVYSIGGAVAGTEVVSVPMDATSNLSATLEGSDCSDSGELQAENIAEFLSAAAISIELDGSGGIGLFSVVEPGTAFAFLEPIG